MTSFARLLICGVAFTTLLLTACKRDESELPLLDMSTVQRPAPAPRAPAADMAQAANWGTAFPIQWTTEGRARVSSSQSQLVTCGPSGRAHSTWGTDIYTNDSSICTAAAHAGIITMELGGPVVVTALGGQGRYTGSRRNGVQTRSYGAWGASFRVSAPPGAR